MIPLDVYLSSGATRLRCGYTTGTCAAAAAQAATELLLGKVLVPSVVVTTPAGIDVIVEVEECEEGPGWARCGVQKDGGDDPDVTDGVFVYATVTYRDAAGVCIDGGVGVGRVTRAGLDQPVGAAAINSTPRQMIAEAVRTVVEAHGFEGGLAVEVSIPEGVELAKRTFNPRLGIEGGISVLGTTGIVRPMSEEALVASIRLELRMLRETGAARVLVVPGNYGLAFAEATLGLATEQAVSCSNHFGATIDEACLLGFESVLIVGHIGKMVKVAGGVMNTHSRVADCRMEVLAAHAAMAGASQRLVRGIMDAPTTDAALDLLDVEGLLQPAMGSLAERLEERLAYRSAGQASVQAIVFSNARGVLCATSGAEELARLHQKAQRTGGEG